MTQDREPKREPTAAELRAERKELQEALREKVTAIEATVGGPLRLSCTAGLLEINKQRGRQRLAAEVEYLRFMGSVLDDISEKLPKEENPTPRPPLT